MYLANHEDSVIFKIFYLVLLFIIFYQNVRKPIACSLHEIAKIMGIRKAEKELL